ncbi:hypothetical protein GGX14DRAFT_570932 [Mycena pura]|uniref:Uncharacterized protein n=1 Tax=Mycena pura TaxID=153505 RepID=A0AAD6Y8E5_9AGAR|nr:hypothetical protein GGX14DRAFT_570932 [Mycena pura]
MDSAQPMHTTSSKVRKSLPVTTVLARRRASENYRKGRLREKARQRMARRRASIQADAALAAESHMRALEACRRYREKNRDKLALQQRELRRIAHMNKFGPEALAEHQTKLRERPSTTEEAREPCAIEDGYRRLEEEITTDQQACREEACKCEGVAKARA